MTISLEVLARIRGTVSATSDAGTPSCPISASNTNTLTDGTGASQGNAYYEDAFSIASAGTANYDLAGSLADPLNVTKVFTAVKAIMVIADSTNTTNLTIGNGTNPLVGPFDDGTATVTLKPGGTFLITDPSAAGMAVAAGTGDVLKIVNGSGATATGRICVIGEA